MIANSQSIGPDGAATDLNANEVRALLAALRSTPGALVSLRETLDRLKSQMTPSGRAAYQREIARMARSRPIVPQSLGELLDGGYGLTMDENHDYGISIQVCSNGGEVSLTLSIDAWGVVCQSVEVDALGCVDSKFAGRSNLGKAILHLRGRLRMHQGYLLLNLELTGKAGKEAIRLQLCGTGDARAGHA